jgi:predicted MFS family arabinose efflux permease
MSLGTVLNGLGLLWLSLADSPLGYLAAWALLGPAMRMTLYDAAFAALVQVTPSRGRQAISFLTLFGGFASTIFWPIGHLLNAEFGWRETFLIYAVANVLICLPLHWWGLARREPGAEAFERAAGERGEGAGGQTAIGRERYLSGRSKTIAIILFAAVMSANAFVFGAIAVHLVNIIVGSGVVLASAVFIASFKGVAQVVGRVWDLVFARNMKPVNIGRVAVFLLPASFAILMLGGASFTTAMIFTLVLGVSNGLVTIVRGAVPLGLFGPKGYGEVLGILATPYLVMNALAPVIFAAIIDAWGYEVGELVLFAAGLLTVSAMEIMAAWIRKIE